MAASETLGVQCPWLHKDEKLLQLLRAAAPSFFPLMSVKFDSNNSSCLTVHGLHWFLSVPSPAFKKIKTKASSKWVLFLLSSQDETEI